MILVLNLCVSHHRLCHDDKEICPARHKTPNSLEESMCATLSTPLHCCDPGTQWTLHKHLLNGLIKKSTNTLTDARPLQSSSCRNLWCLLGGLGFLGYFSSRIRGYERAVELILNLLSFYTFSSQSDCNISAFVLLITEGTWPSCFVCVLCVRVQNRGH